MIFIVWYVFGLAMAGIDFDYKNSWLKHLVKKTVKCQSTLKNVEIEKRLKWVVQETNLRENREMKVREKNRENESSNFQPKIKEEFIWHSLWKLGFETSHGIDFERMNRVL